MTRKERAAIWLLRVSLAAQCYCFLVAAGRAFVMHDGGYALIAALLLGSIGVETYALVRRFKKMRRAP